jgi:putative DNA primase/helicase
MKLSENIPAELKEKPQWVAWKRERRNGKDTKPPINVKTGKYAHSDKPHTWATFDECMRAVDNGCDGVGYVVTRDDKITFIDLDHCRNRETGDLNDEARRWVARFKTYMEVSVSDDGLHILARGSVPKSHKKGDFEIYDNTRFFTVSGAHIEGTPLSIEPCQDAIDEFYNEKFAEIDQKEQTTHTSKEATNKPGLTHTDSRLLAIAKGDGLFKFLFDTSDLSGTIQRKGKDEPVNYASASEADYALVNKLAYYTNGDFDRMLRFARASKRLRSKWQTGRSGVTWIEREINTAISNMTEGFQDADILEYLDKKGKVSADLVAKDILKRERFLTFIDSGPRSDRFEMYHYNGQIYQLAGRSFIEQEVERLVKHKSTTGIAHETVEKISRLTRAKRDEIDAKAPRELIPLRDKIYNIKTGEFADYSPDMPLFIRHPGMYKPELLDIATIGWATLKQIFAERAIDPTKPDERESDLPIIQEFAGSCFYRKSLFKKALLCLGDGDNGKSLFLTLLENAVGSENVSHRTLQILSNNRFASLALYHKTANIQADIGADLIRGTGMFKTITGGDNVDAEIKHGDAISFVNTATLEARMLK